MGFSGSDGIKRNINQATNDLNKSADALSSGKRNVKDNPASFAVAQMLDADAAQVSVSSRNVADGASLLNTFESTVSQVGTIMDRLAELATQSANGTLSDSQRTSLNAEFTQLKDEIARQTGSTEFNSVNLGDQVSIEVGGGSQLSFNTADPAQINAALNSLDISSQSAAQNAINLIAESSSSITALKGSYGAAQSRLESIDSTLEDKKIGLQTASSRIRDVDVAETLANLTAESIRQESAVSILNVYKNLNSRLLQ